MRFLKYCSAETVFEQVFNFLSVPKKMSVFQFLTCLASLCFLILKIFFSWLHALFLPSHSLFPISPPDLHSSIVPRSPPFQLPFWLVFTHLLLTCWCSLGSFLDLLHILWDYFHSFDFSEFWCFSYIIRYPLFSEPCISFIHSVNRLICGFVQSNKGYRDGQHVVFSWRRTEGKNMIPDGPYYVA